MMKANDKSEVLHAEYIPTNVTENGFSHLTVDIGRIQRLEVKMVRLRLTIIVHYLSRTRKPQFITGYPFDIGGIVFKGGDLLPESPIVLLEFGDLYRKIRALRLHPIVFYHSHLTHDAGDQKVERETNPCRNEGDFPASSPGMLFSLYIVSFAHGCSYLQPRLSS
jgi:hypothetical protein